MNQHVTSKVKQGSLLGLLVSTGLIAGTSTPAAAADSGNWRYDCNSRVCMISANAGQAASSQKDSDFGDDVFLPSGVDMNDNVMYVANDWSSVDAQAFRHTNYSNSGSAGTACTAPGGQAGPYSHDGSSQFGLSSFKNCS